MVTKVYMTLNVCTCACNPSLFRDSCALLQSHLVTVIEGMLCSLNIVCGLSRYRCLYSLIWRQIILTCIQVQIPSTDTTYWCVAVQLPEEIRTQTKYITKVGISIYSSTFFMVHSLLSIACVLDTMQGWFVYCYIPLYRVCQQIPI